MSSSTRTPAPSVAAIVVQVIGRVRNPGVYELPAGSRVTDAIDAAGGIRSGATSGRLNLARVLVDGEQIDVGRDTQAPAPSVAQPGTPTPSAGPLDLNAATSADLEALPGVGPVLAQRIVDWRTQNGPFPSVDVLGEVPGIGDVMLERLRPLVVVR